MLLDLVGIGRSLGIDGGDLLVIVRSEDVDIFSDENGILLEGLEFLLLLFDLSLDDTLLVGGR